MDALRIAHARALNLLAELVEGDLRIDCEVSTLVASGGFAVRISVEPVSEKPPLQTNPANRLTPLMRSILAVLTGQPARKGIWIAARLGRKDAGGGFRQALADLLRMGELVKGEDGFGYMLPPSGTSAP